MDANSLYDGTDCEANECYKVCRAARHILIFCYLQVQKDGNKFGCRDAKLILELDNENCLKIRIFFRFREKSDDPWQLARGFGCYNKYLLDDATNLQIDRKIRCRKNSESSM